MSMTAQVCRSFGLGELTKDSIPIQAPIFEKFQN
jgi:hypothetical protein